MITETVAEYLKDLHLRDGFFYKRANSTKGIKVGDPNQGAIDKAQDLMKKLLAAAGEYRNFNKKMKERARYDYDDMIQWVLKAFRENEDLLRSLQERYQYILVDEFQDTSGSQNELLRFYSITGIVLMYCSRR